jgi:ketosteroid isomerase-like protein
VRTRFACLAAALALVAPGCGESESEDDRVRDVLAKLADATAKKDYARLCDEVFAPELLKRVSRAGATCQDALRAGLNEVRSPKLVVRRVTVKGDRAQATVRTSATGQAASNDVVNLAKTRGEWRVVSLGTGSRSGR